MANQRLDRELLRRFRVTVVLLIVSAVAGLAGALLNSVPCELAFVTLAVLAVLSGWIKAVRAERDDGQA